MSNVNSTAKCSNCGGGTFQIVKGQSGTIYAVCDECEEACKMSNLCTAIGKDVLPQEK